MPGCYESWCMCGCQRKLGPSDLWQTSDSKFKIPSAPAQANRGRSLDTGTYGKHQTKSLKFPVHQHRPTVAEVHTLGLLAHQTKNSKFLVHQHRPTVAEIWTLGPMASITLKESIKNIFAGPLGISIVHPQASTTYECPTIQPLYPTFQQKEEAASKLVWFLVLFLQKQMNKILLPNEQVTSQWSNCLGLVFISGLLVQGGGVYIIHKTEMDYSR